jgi:hypothetical protein
MQLWKFSKERRVQKKNSTLWSYYIHQNPYIEVCASLEQTAQTYIRKVGGKETVCSDVYFWHREKRSLSFSFSFLFSPSLLSAILNYILDERKEKEGKGEEEKKKRKR